MQTVERVGGQSNGICLRGRHARPRQPGRPTVALPLMAQQWQDVPGLRMPASMRPRYKSSDNPYRRELSALADSASHAAEPSKPKSARDSRPSPRVSFATPAPGAGSQSARGAAEAMEGVAPDGLAARTGLNLPGLHTGDGRTSYTSTTYDGRTVVLMETSLPPPQLAAPASTGGGGRGPRHPFKGERARPSNRSEAALLSAQLDMALADPSITFRAEQQVHDHVFEQVVKQVAVHCGERGELLHKLRRYYMRDKDLTMRSATRAAKQCVRRRHTQAPASGPRTYSARAPLSEQHLCSPSRLVCACSYARSMHAPHAESGVTS